MAFAEHPSRHGHFEAFEQGVEVCMDEVVFFYHFVSAAEADTNGIGEHVDEDRPFARGAGGAENVPATTAVVFTVDKIEGNGASEASLFGWEWRRKEGRGG